jgi:hypothetical protein
MPAKKQPYDDALSGYPSGECRCDQADDTFQGLLCSDGEGHGLSLHCAGCGGWVEDAWLFTDGDGIPVTVETATSQDYTSGEVLTYYGLAPRSGAA